MGHIRRHVSVQQDMTILEVLHVWAGLQMLLQGVAALVGRGSEGRFVDRHGK